MIEFPISPVAYLSVFGAAFFASLVTQWLKRYIKLDLVVNLVTLILAWGAAFVAVGVVTQWRPAGEHLFTAFMVGFFGATVAVFGYETIKNAYDLVGQVTELFRPKS